MITLGLTGWPVSHSLSPVMHNGALKVLGITGEYRLFPADPEKPEELEYLVDQVRKRVITGLNVTIPHKQSVIKHLDQLSPTAEKIGAVNTIYLKDNKVVGHNTDSAGFYHSLSTFIDTTITDQSAIVLGSGGSSRAIIYSLLEKNWNVYLAARNTESGKELCNYFNVTKEKHKVQLIDLGKIGQIIEDMNLVINATPAGMVPNIEQTPIPIGVITNKNIFIYDLVYNPRETLLIRQCKESGIKAVNGIGMLLEQAALSFEIWTGKKAPREVMLSMLSK